MSGLFAYSNPSVIRWGAGALGGLAAELEARGARRVALVTTRSLLENRALVERVRAALPAGSIEVEAVVGQHAPIADLEAATTRVGASGAEAVVSFGGGSPIDAAKVISIRAAEGRGSHDRPLPHIAIPTTLSMAELASGAGFTDAAGNKVGLRDPRGLPAAVIYDAELTLATPMSLWLSTGIRALDHAIENYLSPGEHPFSDVLSLEAVRRLFRTLPLAKADPNDLRVRTENQLAGWFSYTMSAAAGGLSHVMGKQIGARFHIPHGVTSCLLLPHVMRHRARREGDRLAEVSGATGSGAGALAAADDVERLIGALGLPQHIAAYGLGEPELRAAAEALAGAEHSTGDLLAIYLAAL